MSFSAMSAAATASYIAAGHFHRDTDKAWIGPMGAMISRRTVRSGHRGQRNTGGGARWSPARKRSWVQYTVHTPNGEPVTYRSLRDAKASVADL